MEEIIASDPEEEGEGGGNIIKKLIPKLKRLELSHLPALKSICSGKRAVMACDSLVSIDICGCKGLRGIFVYLPSPPYLFVSDLDKLDGLFEAQVIASNSPPPPTPFSSLKRVSIQQCPKIKKLFPSWKLVEYLQSLEMIFVYSCEEMEEIIASDPEAEGEGGGNIIKKLILPKLKRLELSHLPALKSIYSGKRAVMACDSLVSIDICGCKGLRGIFVYLPSPPYLFVSDLDKLDGLFEAQVIASNSPPPPTPFSSLKRVSIQQCPKIKKLFPSWKLVEYLQSLEMIFVYSCEEMEEIIASDPEEEGEGGAMIKKLTLPKLKKLELTGIPALKSICSGERVVMACDSLERIEIGDCKGLRRIFVYLPSGPPTAFSSLKTIQIQSCHKIKKLFPSWKLVEYLQSLEMIEVNDCDEMEEIIASDPEEEGKEGDIIKKLILPKLKKLRLGNLPALKSICSRRAVMVCDSLEEIGIGNCKGLRRIPIYLPLSDNAQPSPPLFLQRIMIYPEEQEWWESLEWDHPNAKDVLRSIFQNRPSTPPSESSEELSIDD